MSEEQTAPAEETPAESAPAEEAPAAAEAPAAQAPAAEAPPEPTAEEGEQKKKKVNQMDLKEVEKAIKKTEEHMKGMNSKYAKALLARKAELEKS